VAFFASPWYVFVVQDNRMRAIDFVIN